jgi:hypothetical protein
MKHVVIADAVQSNLIYCDHPNGTMSHLLIDQTQSVLQTSLNEPASHWRAGRLLFVLGRFANVSAMIVSDAGESVRTLREKKKKKRKKKKKKKKKKQQIFISRRLSLRRVA